MGDTDQPSDDSAADWRRLYESLPEAIDPFYRQRGVDARIPLYRGPIPVREGAHATTTVGLITAEFASGFDIVAKYVTPLDLSRPKDLFAFGPLPAVHLPSHPRALSRPVRPRAPERPSPPYVDHSVRVSHLAWSSAEPVVRVVGHIVNSPDIHGRPVRYADGAGSDRLSVIAGDWALTFDAHPDGRRHLSHLKESGGYLVTGLLELRRADDGSFAFPEASSVIDGVTMFLWFVSGRRVSPILPVGYAADGAPVVADWSERSVDRWRDVISWLDPAGGGDDLEQLLPLWLDCWRDAHWREILTLVVRPGNGSTTGNLP